MALDNVAGRFEIYTFSTTEFKTFDLLLKNDKTNLNDTGTLKNQMCLHQGKALTIPTAL